MNAPEVILVLDYGSQYNQLICRRIRELGVYSELFPPDVSFKWVQALNPKGVILSGGPASVYEKKAPKLPSWLFEKKIPVLGICYGMQLLAFVLGGKVRSAKAREYGPEPIFLRNSSKLFEGVQSGSLSWMSHGDEVVQLPPGFTILAESSSGSIAAIGNEEKKMYGVQFHPEVSHTEFGTLLLKNFLEICGCKFSWSMASFVEDSVAKISAEIGANGAICAVSGGVDSTVAAYLVSKAIGKNLHAIFVDNGLLRQGEKEEVVALLSDFPMTLHVLEASDIFLKRLKNVSNPEEKRKIIGRTFIHLFEKKARELKGIKFLIQGTLYPDVIESSVGKNLSVTIKTHHNVGGLPKKMKLRVIEPLRFLFKDEVRVLGKNLGLPQSILNRQPFPGPGLAVRVLGRITRKKLDLLRSADAVVRQEIEKFPDARNLWQFFAVLLPLRTVGVMGDKRTYEHVVAIRAVHSSDGMTASWAKLPWDVLSKISSRIVSEVRGINRVVYDITPKPPGTIEWE
jgi:GMP synthase (glutamine-hydrolysing)